MEDGEKGLDGGDTTYMNMQNILYLWQWKAIPGCEALHFLAQLIGITCGFTDGRSELQRALGSGQALHCLGAEGQTLSCLPGMFPSLFGTGCFLMQAGLLWPGRVHECCWWGCGCAACSDRCWVGMAAKGGKPLMRGRTAGGELDNILCHGKPDKVGVYFCGKEQLSK